MGLEKLTSKERMWLVKRRTVGQVVLLSFAAFFALCLIVCIIIYYTSDYYMLRLVIRFPLQMSIILIFCFLGLQQEAKKFLRIIDKLS